MACAIGSVYKGKPVGASGNLNCFSFHPRKVLVTGEGGMIATGDAKLWVSGRLQKEQPSLRVQMELIWSEDKERYIPKSHVG